jgi:hypothetical protein
MEKSVSLQRKINLIILHTVLILILLLKKCFNAGSAAAAWYSSKEFSYCCLYIPQIQYSTGPEFN